jgi:hypothetical protein
MADETPRVNQAGCFSLGQPKSEQSRDRLSRRTRRVTAAARMQLVEELPGPIEESAELIRIGHKINNERYRGQHEDRVSHGGYPAPTC